MKKALLVIVCLSFLLPSISFAIKPDSPAPEGTTQLLSAAQFTLPMNNYVTLGSGIDVSNCSKIRLSVSVKDFPVGTYDPKASCSISDDDSGVLLSLDSTTQTNFGSVNLSMSSLVDLPSSGTVTVVCRGLNANPSLDIGAALYCR